MGNQEAMINKWLDQRRNNKRRALLFKLLKEEW
jgi:hypothetical protein